MQVVRILVAIWIIGALALSIFESGVRSACPDKPPMNAMVFLAWPVGAAAVMMGHGVPEGSPWCKGEWR